MYKTHTSQKIIVLLFFLVYIIAPSQSLTIMYELIHKPSKVDKNTKSKIYYLDVVNQESVFRDEIRKKSDSLIYYGNNYGLGYPNINEQIYLKKNLKTNRIIRYYTSMINRDKFYIPITEIINWKLSTDIRVIGDMKCQKAETTYGGRHWTAWFAQEIQISEGPYIFHGLPGLITEIYDDNEDYLFRLIKTQKFNQKNLYVSEENQGKEINWEIFKKLMLDFYADPYAYIKTAGYKAMTDDGNGGMKKLDFREATFEIQKTLREKNNPIELNQKIDFK
jgi:GLPGLI family protein